MSISQWFLKSNFYFLRLDQPPHWSDHCYYLLRALNVLSRIFQAGTVLGTLTWNILILTLAACL